MSDTVTIDERSMQSRTELLLGSDALARIQSARVLLFGLGGVGSWCAEALVRSGIRHITIVDADCVSPSNCNRQLIATSRTVGRPKTEVLRERLLEINPAAEVTAIRKIYDSESAESFHMEEYDFIIDAIDSLKDKADLILRATALPESVTFFSSMGAALRIDPFKVRQAEFYSVKGDPLARAIRKRFKHMGVTPSRKFMCVYSEELPMENKGEDHKMEEADPSFMKAQTNGSLCHITAIFGMSVAGLVLNSILNR